jgi:hypothetical protein
MEIPSREELERRLHALIADQLDILERDNPEGFDVGVAAFAIEVIYPDPEDTWIRREEGKYFPPVDTYSYWFYYCTDHRLWVKKAVFRTAHESYEYPQDSPDGDEGNDEEAPTG